MAYSLPCSSVVYRLMQTQSGLAFQPHCGMMLRGAEEVPLLWGLGTSHIQELLVGSVNFLRKEKKLEGDPGNFPSSGVCFMSKSR